MSGKVVWSVGDHAFSLLSSTKDDSIFRTDDDLGRLEC